MWTYEELRATAQGASGVGSDADLPDEVRFVAGVAKLIRRRAAEAAAAGITDEARTSVFFLKPMPPEPIASTAERAPMLNNGMTALAGRFWFVNATVVTGKFLSLPKLADDELFAVSTNYELDQEIAIVFDPRPAVPELRYYVRGLSSPEDCQIISLESEAITLERIIEVVDAVYRTQLITPEAQSRAGKLWKDSSKWWPAQDAEDVVQLYLRAGLATAFATCSIRHEQTGVSGRLDLQIEERHPLHKGQLTNHAVLELKVLRSFGSTGGVYSEETTAEWVDSGVKQAATYRDERGGRAAALCCFDMRKTDSKAACFEPVRDLARRLNVALHRWYIYATSDQYREAATAD